jgi:ubiquinone/menaquinone biosynthesis C-methylase UbiE
MLNADRAVAADPTAAPIIQEGELTDPNDLYAAATAWNDPAQTIEAANADIHDGVSADQFVARAEDYVRQIFAYFTYLTVPQHARILEIGSGTGFIMEAMARALAARNVEPQTIIGLDIAEHMLAKARQRLGDRRPFGFLHYDGFDVPLPDQSLDLIYSVAALQHVPKPYVYNLFFEIHRLLKPSGFAVMHLLSFAELKIHQERWESWRDEISRQVGRRPGHWHHFYAADELATVLRIGTGFEHVDVLYDGRWTCVARSPISN